MGQSRRPRPGLARQSRLHPGARDQYTRIYRSWRLRCASLGVPPFQARRADLISYTTALEQVGNPATPNPRPLSRRSVARHMAAVSSYYRAAISGEITDYNPVPPQGRPKVSRSSPQPYLDPGQLRALVAAADADSPRSSALVALLVLACLRISEALGADIDDLTTGAAGVRFLRVRRKGDKTEDVPLPPPAAARIAAAVAGRRDGPLLATRSGRRWDRKAAWQTVRRLGARAGIEVPIGNHTLRHAYITRGHELEIPVADLQDAAGHESVDTTRGYDRRRFDPDRHPSFRIAADLIDS
jgi:integrase